MAVAVQLLFCEYLFKIFGIGSFQWMAQLNEKMLRLQFQAKHNRGQTDQKTELPFLNVSFENCVPSALQRQNTEIFKQIFPEKEYRGLSPNFQIHASVIDLYIPTIGLPILLEELCRPILGLHKSLTDT